jgi:hypothetical protein
MERHHLGLEAPGAETVAHLLARRRGLARCGRQNGDPAGAQGADCLVHRAIVGLEPAADDDEPGIRGEGAGARARRLGSGWHVLVQVGWRCGQDGAGSQ